MINGKFSLVFLATAFAFISGCKKENLEVTNLHNGKIITCGHGGSGFQNYTNPLPANSFEAVQNGLEALNTDAAEIDVQLTKDNKLYLYHDNNLHSATSCFGCIPEITSAEIENCEFIRNMGANASFENIKIVSLEKVLTYYSQFTHKKLFYLDVKLTNTCHENKPTSEDTMAIRLVEMINKFNGKEWIYVCSGSTKLLDKVKEIDSTIVLMLDGSDDNLIDLIISKGYKGAVVPASEITKEQVEHAHKNNIEVVLFGVRTRQSTIESIQKNPDCIQTDNIEMLQEILSEK